MKNELIAAVFLAGSLGQTLRGNGVIVASELERKRFIAEHQLASAQEAKAAAGSDPWDHYAVPQALPLHGATVYQALSRPSLPIRIYRPASITSSPSSVKVEAGRPVTLLVGATGTEVLTYQWRRNGIEIPGARSFRYTFTASFALAGSYDCVVSNDETAVSGAATVTVTAPITGKFVGTFHGLIERDAALNGNLASSIQLTTTTTGFYSGKILTGATAISLMGQFTVSPADLTKASLSQFIPKLGATLTLTLDISTDTLSGHLTKEGFAGVSVSGWRNGWADVAGNASKFKGLHTFALSPGDRGVAIPQGYGFGAFTVLEKTGLLTLSGSLPDGSKIVGSTFVGPSGQVLLYVPLYTNLGSFAGTLRVTPGVVAPLGNVISGAPTWLKPSPALNSKETLYKNGFGPVAFDAAGGFYVVPAKGERVLGLPVGADNAEVVFSSGGLDLEGKEFTQSVTISNPSALGVTNKVTLGLSPNKVTVLGVTPATGLFSGDFTLAGSTRKAPFSGQIVTVAGVSRGFGFFVLPKVPGVGETVLTAPRLSGGVILEKRP